MAFILPNFFLESGIGVNAQNVLFAVYSSKAKNVNVEARLTTHCLVVLLEGAKKISLNDSHAELTAGEMVFLSQNNYLMSEIIPERGEYRALLIYFNDDFVQRFVSKYRIVSDDGPAPLPLYKTQFDDEDVFALNIALLQRYVDKEEPRLLVMKLEELLLNCLNDTQFEAFLNAIESTRSSRLQAILESNLDMLETVGDMCRLSGLSAGALRQRLLRDTGKTPKKWLDGKRLERAKMLLENSDMPVSAVATECGYATLSWFIQCFKAHYKKTPGEIRQKK